MGDILALAKGEICIEPLRLQWDNLTFSDYSTTTIEGSSSAPISDFLYLVAGLQRARRLTCAAPPGRVLRPVVSVPYETLRKISYRGRPLYDLSSQERATEIGFVFNDPELALVGTTAQEDINQAFAAVGRRAPSMSLCSKYGFTKDKLSRRVDVLSGGELHRLLCLTAVEKQPRVLILDLTRSNLDDDFVLELRAIADGLQRSGSCVIASGFDGCAGNVTTLHARDDGKIGQSETLEESKPTLEDEEIRLARKLHPRDVGSCAALEVHGVHRPNVTAPMSFSVKDREIVILYGPNGCGKTTLGLVVAHRCSRADYRGYPIVREGYKPVVSLQHAHRAFLDSCLLGEDPDMSFWSRIGFTTDAVKAHPRTLPYGLQKLAACALALRRSRGLCILDEPSCGMDYAMKERLVDLLNEFPTTAILMLSHDRSLSGLGRKLTFDEVSKE